MTDAYHTLVVGDAGGGKTTLLREYHADFDGLSIWINHNNETGIRTKGPRIKYHAGALDESVLNDVRNKALQYTKETGYPAQIVLDEAQVIMNEELSSKHPLKRMLHEDRDKRIKVVLATQDPSDLQPNYSAIKQCRWYVWCGGWSVFHDGFIRYFNVPRDELPEEKYRYVVFDKRMQVQYRGVTDKTYS